MEYPHDQTDHVDIYAHSMLESDEGLTVEHVKHWIDSGALNIDQAEAVVKLYEELRDE